jgi:serine phosphatase RsbU (regulator of sigma subunit)
MPFPGTSNTNQETVEREILLDRLARQLGLFDQLYAKLPRGASVKDIAAQCAAVVSAIYPSSTIGLYHRPDVGVPWGALAEGMGEAPAIDLASTEAPFASSINDKSSKAEIVQRLADGSTLGLTLAERDASNRLTDFDITCLRVILHLFDASYQKMLAQRSEKGLVFSLNHKVLQLTSLIDTGIEIAKLDQESSPQRLALERAASLTNASYGTVKVARSGAVTEMLTFPAGASPKAEEVSDEGITAGFEFGGETYTFALHGKESRTGAVPFEETDQLLLDALSRQVQASLEIQHFHKLALEKQKIEQELEVASSIQQRILPQSLPSIAGYDIAGTNIPSKSVGGDYYNCIPLHDGRYALVVADVTGKGVPAALLVSSLHAFLWAFFENPMPLDLMARRLNAVTYSSTTDDRFITAFIALLSPETGEIECVNAGHNPAYLLRNDGTIQELTVGGLALGLLDIDYPFQTERAVIAPGERLLLYTDGVTEATNERDELYDSGVPLNEFVLRTTPERAEQFIQSLIADVKRFTGDAPQNDDITALYLLRR